MDQFEYVTTLLAFVVAFGVSRLLAGWVTQFNHRSQTAVYPLQLAVSGLMLIALLQSTWAIWMLRDVVWTFGTFLLMMLSQLALVGASALVQPPADHRASIRDHYFSARHAVFGLCAAWVILGGTMEIVLIHTGSYAPFSTVPLAVVLTLRAVAVLPFAFLAWSDRPSHHWAGFAALALLQLVWVLEVSNSPAV